MIHCSYPTATPTLLSLNLPVEENTELKLHRDPVVSKGCFISDLGRILILSMGPWLALLYFHRKVHVNVPDCLMGTPRKHSTWIQEERALELPSWKPQRRLRRGKAIKLNSIECRGWEKTDFQSFRLPCPVIDGCSAGWRQHWHRTAESAVYNFLRELFSWDVLRCDGNETWKWNPAEPD